MEKTDQKTKKGIGSTEISGKKLGCGCGALFLVFILWGVFSSSDPAPSVQQAPHHPVQVQQPSNQVDQPQEEVGNIIVDESDDEVDVSSVPSFVDPEPVTDEPEPIVEPIIEMVTEHVVEPESTSEPEPEAVPEVVSDHEPLPPSLEPDSEPEPVVPTCSCDGDIYNCGDFNTHASAQACHDYCMVMIGSDVHGLDGNDNDGLACEGLP